MLERLSGKVGRRTAIVRISFEFGDDTMSCARASDQ